MNVNNVSQKELWETPKLTQYGTVADITQVHGNKNKHLGTVDDFGITGISNP